MNDTRAIFVHSPELEKTSYPDTSPFKTQRAAMTRKTILSMGLLGSMGREERTPVAATREQLEMFHTPPFLEAIRKAEEGELDAEAFNMGLGTPDCPVFRGMYDYVSLAVGASITGALAILNGEADVAFNPSGGLHHAGPAQAAGFCYMNDIVLAAMVLADAGKRVLCLDVDVHHGDGTQNAFYARKDVMTISMHETGKSLFPGTGYEHEIGEGEGRGYCVNLPMPVGTYDDAYEGAFREAVYPLMRAFDPDVIVVELGMDGLSGDPLAHLHLTNNVYADIIGLTKKLGKPILATGGGGYNVENTVRGWALAWGELCGEQDDEMSLGMGGVMLENRDWFGGLRDRVLLSEAGRRADVGQEVKEVVGRIKATVFPLHGI